MYLRDLARGLARRWYILLIGVVLTIPAAILAFVSTPVTYTAQASMVLLPPSSSVDKTGNPYLQLDGLAQALEILGQRMSSESERSTIAEDHPGVTYNAGPDTTTSGPILLLSTEAPRADGALRTLTDLRQSATTTLDEMQAQLDVPSASRIRITDVAVDDSPTVSSKSRTQVTLILVAAGIVLTVIVAGVVDRALSARRRRVEEGDVTEAEAEAEAEEPAPDADRAADAADEAELLPVAAPSWADEPQATTWPEDDADDETDADETSEPGVSEDDEEPESSPVGSPAAPVAPRRPGGRTPGRSRR